MAVMKKSWMRRHWLTLLSGVLVVLFVAAYLKPWPYMLYGPGSAEPVHPRVETGHKLEEKGQLLFTTVSTYSNPNIFSIIYARISKRMDVKPESEATGGATNMEAYRNLLAWMRDSSEANALLAAYTAMKKPIDVQEQGVIVYALLPESKAREGGLQEGDIINAVDGTAAKTVTELSGFLQNKKAGDKVTVSGTRGEKTFKATVELIKMPSGDRIGIGFQNETVLKVTAPDPVKFDFADTGGPSAGLMMTLEIIAQLNGEDLTRGYNIAGTGTISADGTVGLIGGINYKLMAADREKADYFLVPYNAKNSSNWDLAQKTVKDLKLKPKLVKVSTLQEALDFLRKLDPKA
ncbi:PDZ domain-containing protein [Cohnella endophytica]|uniref:PDZ domain-containing protein n=1 Tax=Cohnella endophytica TaxID=2419778 RepID=A0A494XKW9_9BACL|nr:PDZ domain-containing protein [Cohnella endophytica]RKP48789.1 PDZ domain-containing protein [Cohnella endophytica]